MTGWHSDNEYWTRKGRIHEFGGGKYIESVKKSLNIVLKSKSRHHAKTTHKEAT